ncbi:MAG: gamma-glutamylcyclotransferase [Rhodospirillaceae bacterium]|nr:gamma-glutamylcyclotransferase [Rhodospirillaceae bacterium]
MRFFFYGTLLDRDVTTLVLGRRLPPVAYVPASLLGHSRFRARGASYPVVVQDPCGEVAGAIVGGLSTRDVGYLAAYEGSGYRIVPLRVRSRGRLVTVSVFEPIVESGKGYRDSRLQPSRELWDLVLWQRRHKRAFAARLRRAFSARPVYSRR